MEKWKKVLAVLLCAVVVASVATVVYAHGGENHANQANQTKDDNDNERVALRASLNGFQQVPAIITNGTGTFTAVLSSDGTMINYTLTYSGLSSQAHFAHIHVGQAGANGGVIVFLCGGGGKPECPATSGTVKGTLTKSDVKAIADQGVAAQSFSALLTAISHGVAYVNVHTTNFPNGEIRGQIKSGEFEQEDD